MEWRVGSVMGGCGRKGRWGAGCGGGGTHINTGFIYRQPPPPTPNQENEGGGGVKDICFHAYSYTIKWEGPEADWYWSCREWQQRVGPSNRLCPNLRICSSSCLHNEVKWSEEMLGRPRPKHGTPDVLLTDLARARDDSGPRSVKQKHREEKLLIPTNGFTPGSVRQIR